MKRSLSWSSGAEDQEKKNEEKQEVNAALQNARPAAAESDDACAKGKKEEGKITTLYA